MELLAQLQHKHPHSNSRGQSVPGAGDPLHHTLHSNKAAVVTPSLLCCLFLKKKISHEVNHEDLNKVVFFFLSWDYITDWPDGNILFHSESALLILEPIAMQNACAWSFLLVALCVTEGKESSLSIIRPSHFQSLHLFHHKDNKVTSYSLLRCFW